MPAVRFFALLLVLWAGPLVAEPSAFAWRGVLNFDPNKVIGRQGGTLGALMSEFYGAGAMGGAVKLSGEVRYETGVATTTANQNVAGFKGAVTAATLRLGAIDTTMNATLIEAHLATSGVGMMTRYDGSFCVDSDHCRLAGLEMTRMGNLAVLLNDTGHTLVDETGPTDKTGDGFGFMVGRTAATGEFEPALQTQGFGVIGVDGLAVAMFSVPGLQLVNGLTLPHMRQLIGTQAIGRSEIWLFLEGPELIETLRIEGHLTGIEADP